ncbi:hypothetical protein AYI68_g850 [Smittium mucronatum]|uniref:Uncharacterized protein n=1 Tax=Smittium mucronatum TaxID=133383 RepID=A0A1R0H724_9FUNG|nr:hypothetical protein AYI68_g850 [Smittium mucronatum]
MLIYEKMYQSTNRKTPFGIASSRYMTEVTCSQELGSLSMKNGSLKLLSSWSEPTSIRINKIRHPPKSGFDQHGFPSNSC